MPPVTIPSCGEPLRWRWRWRGRWRQNQSDKEFQKQIVLTVIWGEGVVVRLGGGGWINIGVILASLTVALITGPCLGHYALDKRALFGVCM